ncbi:MAG: metal-dependent hydrolase [Methanofollis sp.]|uniref:metal-dependent hydrolase n=1 Tax=Methanofollis sp. TaxID=2052835 RepID=UPI002606E977|nr:metal-dependent hydrolase [Methanofollis sp.]MDD4255502.1 metal-dependent hydrolase [Methanofollis sp.]
MFLLCHLAAGIVLGLLLAGAVGERRAVVAACALGALLPDLIDKPLGYIVLADSIGYGRIYTHTLIFLVLAIGVGLLVFWRFRSPIVLAGAVGVASHQALDTMWAYPANWLYPFLGPFTGGAESRDLWSLLMSELSEPSEWILFAALFIVAALFLKKEFRTALLDRVGPLLETIRLPLGGALMLLAGIMILSGVFSLHWIPTGLEKPLDLVLCGLVIGGAGLAILWLHRQVHVA